MQKWETKEEQKAGWKMQERNYREENDSLIVRRHSSCTQTHIMHASSVKLVIHQVVYKQRKITQHTPHTD